jgi:hypothetical protein
MGRHELRQLQHVKESGDMYANKAAHSTLIIHHRKFWIFYCNYFKIFDWFLIVINKQLHHINYLFTIRPQTSLTSSRTLIISKLNT